MAESVCTQVYYVQRGTAELGRLIMWADVLHVQNMPPDIVFPARLLSKKVLLTVHNRRLPAFSLHNAVWGISIQLGHRRWYNSQFVWAPGSRGTSHCKAPAYQQFADFPSSGAPPTSAKGFCS